MHHRIERHTRFVMPSGNANCYLSPEYIMDIEESCNYVRNISDCSNGVRLFDYLDFMVCTLNVDTSIRSMCIMIAFVGIILFVYIESLYIIAMYFLVPNFVTFANHVNVLGFDFGLTFIALLLGLPEFVNNFFICKVILHENPALLLAASIGEVMACFSIGLAVVSFNRVIRFKSMHFTRNTLIIILGNTYLVEILRYMMNNPKKQKSLTFHASNFLLIYGAYMFFIILAYKCNIRNSGGIDDGDDEENYSRTLQEAAVQSSRHSLASDEYSDHNNPIHDELDPWTLFIYAINPYMNMKGLPKWYIILVTPIFIMCALLIPVLNKDRPLHGWCKSVVCLSFITYPFHFKLIGVAEEFFHGLLFIGILGATLILIITHVQRVPQHHGVSALSATKLTVVK